MRMRACLIAAVLSIAPFSLAKAEPVGFGVAFDELYRIDLGTRQATYVGTAGDYAGLPLAALTGLSYGPGNELYAVAGNQKSLVRINALSGAASFVGDLGLSGQGEGQFDALDLSLTYGCDGSFWMTSAINRNLWRVNAQTGATTLVGSTGRLISGLAMRNGILYGTGVGSDQGLYRIDIADSGSHTCKHVYRIDTLESIRTLAPTARFGRLTATTPRSIASGATLPASTRRLERRPTLGRLPARIACGSSA